MASADLIAQGIVRRRAILAFIKHYTKRNGFPPSLVEIAEGIGLSSKNAVRGHIAILVQEGHLAVSPGKYRSYRVIEPPKPEKKVTRRV